MIAFTTATDLLRHSVRYDVTVFARISQCATQAIDFARLLAGGEAIYDREGKVMFRYRGPATAPPDTEGQYTFHAFLPLERSGLLSIPDRNPPWHYPIYDLRRDTADVCFRLTGGNYFGSITSNTVRIPAPLIRQALDRAGM